MALANARKVESLGGIAFVGAVRWTDVRKGSICSVLTLGCTAGRVQVFRTDANNREFNCWKVERASDFQEDLNSFTSP